MPWRRPGQRALVSHRAGIEQELRAAGLGKNAETPVPVLFAGLSKRGLKLRATASHTTQLLRYFARVSHFELPPLANLLRAGSHFAFAP